MEEEQTQDAIKEINTEKVEEHEAPAPREFSSRGINTTRDSIHSIESGSSMLLLVFKEVKRGCDGPCSISKIKLMKSGSGCSQTLYRKSSKGVSGELKDRVKGFSRKLKKTSKKSLDALKNIYKDATAARAKGFSCNLKECDSSVLDCSKSACKDKGMSFGRASDPSQNKGETSEVATPRPDCKSKCKFSKKKLKPDAPGKSKKQKEAKDNMKESKLAKYLAGKDFYGRCKRDQVCECPDNPGKYFKSQGYAMCCCLNDKCVIFSKTEDKGTSDSSEKILADKNASPSQ